MRMAPSALGGIAAPSPRPRFGLGASDSGSGGRLGSGQRIAAALIVWTMAVSLASVPVNAAIVTSTHVELGPGFPVTYPASPTATHFSLQIQQFSQYGRDHTSAFFELDAFVLSCVTNVDEGSDWYWASYGDAFASDTTDRFPVLSKWNSTGYELNPTAVPAEDFYLAFNTGNESSPWLPRNVFGWVHLSLSGGTVDMLDNAVAYDEGIVIGKAEPVPEPATFGLAFLGIAVGFVFRANRL